MKKQIQPKLAQSDNRREVTKQPSGKIHVEQFMNAISSSATRQLNPVAFLEVVNLDGA
jgi:hypothetical protein